MLETVTLDLLDPTAANAVRALRDPEVVQDYAAQMGAGAVFPPLRVCRDEAAGKLWVWDGGYRLAAALAAGRSAIDCMIEPGEYADALARARREGNVEHGVRRSNADKERIGRDIVREELDRRAAGHPPTPSRDLGALAGGTRDKPALSHTFINKLLKQEEERRAAVVAAAAEDAAAVAQIRALAPIFRGYGFERAVAWWGDKVPLDRLDEALEATKDRWLLKSFSSYLHDIVNRDPREAPKLHDVVRVDGSVLVVTTDAWRAGVRMLRPGGQDELRELTPFEWRELLRTAAEVIVVQQARPRPGDGKELWGPAADGHDWLCGADPDAAHLAPPPPELLPEGWGELWPYAAPEAAAQDVSEAAPVATESRPAPLLGALTPERAVQGVLVHSVDGGPRAPAAILADLARALPVGWLRHRAESVACYELSTGPDTFYVTVESASVSEPGLDVDGRDRTIAQFLAELCAAVSQRGAPPPSPDKEFHCPPSDTSAPSCLTESPSTPSQTPSLDAAGSAAISTSSAGSQSPDLLPPAPSTTDPEPSTTLSTASSTLTPARERRAETRKRGARAGRCIQVARRLLGHGEEALEVAFLAGTSRVPLARAVEELQRPDLAEADLCAYEAAFYPPVPESPVPQVPAPPTRRERFAAAEDPTGSLVVPPEDDEAEPAPPRRAPLPTAGAPASDELLMALRHRQADPDERIELPASVTTMPMRTRSVASWLHLARRGDLNAREQAALLAALRGEVATTADETAAEALRGRLEALQAAGVETLPAVIDGGRPLGLGAVLFNLEVLVGQVEDLAARVQLAEQQLHAPPAAAPERDPRTDPRPGDQLRFAEGTVLEVREVSATAIRAFHRRPDGTEGLQHWDRGAIRNVWRQCEVLRVAAPDPVTVLTNLELEERYSRATGRKFFRGWDRAQREQALRDALAVAP